MTKRAVKILDWQDVNRWSERIQKAKPIRYKTVTLKPHEWHKCKVCDGKGNFEEAEDLHRSAGIVPCRHCHDGTVKSIVKPVYRVKAEGRKR